MKKGLPGIASKRRTSPVTTNPSIAVFDSKNGTGSTTHNLTNVPIGAWLYITTQSETHSGNATINSTPSLPWSKVADSQAEKSGDAEIHRAQFTAGGTISVTSTWAAQSQSSTIYVIINSESTPGGATSIVVSQALPSAILTTTRVESIIIGVTSDWNAVNGVSRIYRNTPTETQYFFASNLTTGYHYYKPAPTIGSYTLGLTAPNMGVGGINGGGSCFVEVRAIPPGGTDTTPPTAPTLSAGTITSSTIQLNWTAATDDFGVVGYDIYVNNSFNTSTGNLTFTITGLAASTSYTIFIKAKDAAGNSTPSNTINPSTIASTGFGTLVYQNGFDTNNDLDPFNHGQIGNGSLNTNPTFYHTGPGSFKSVPASVSSGIRSEVDLTEVTIKTEGIVEWYAYYDVVFQNNGHSFQFHPTTSGGSASPGLWHQGGKWSWVNWKGGVNTFHDTNHTILQGHWYYLRIEYKFGTAGYFRFYIDNVLNAGGSWIGQVGDNSAPYMKVGVNQWVNQTSIVYYDDLKIWQP